MNQPPRICVVGSSNMDLIFRTPRLPAPGETLAGHSFQLCFGGKGANQAVMAARLGAKVTMVSKVGDDVFGEQTLANYRSHGIDTAHVSSAGEQPTGTASILVDDLAQNCIIVVAGANGSLTADEVNAAAAAISQADVLLCQLEVPIEATLAACRIACARQVRVLFNPAPAVAIPEELLRLTDWCVPNETEMVQMTGQHEIEAAARSLAKRGPQTVIVTLGARGVLLVQGPQVEYVPAFEMSAVDTTGAGDAFIGALAVFQAEGLALPEAARWANAAAALSVTRPGAQASYPTRTEVETLLAARSPLAPIR